MSLRLRKRRTQDGKDDLEVEWSAKQAKQKSKGDERCIIHSPGLLQYGNFTSFESCGKKDKPGENLRIYKTFATND